MAAAAEPLGVELRRADGAVVWRGASEPVRDTDWTSGQLVHLVEAELPPDLEGRFRLHVGALESHLFQVRPGLYSSLASDALRVLTLLRSGHAVSSDVAEGYEGPAGHVGIPPNSGDRAVPAWSGLDAERLYPGWRCPGTFDVSGGWYDAGDYGKYTTSSGIALWQLLAVIDLLDHAGASSSTFAAFRSQVLDECRWQLDWMLRMQVPAGSPDAGMAFHRVHGEQWSPTPGAAHADPTRRVLHRPSTAATFHLAATAARGARVFDAIDPTYAQRLLTAAETGYTAGTTHPVFAPPDDHARFGGGPYDDDDSSDDRYWAAVQLWLATRDPAYRADFDASPWHSAGRAADQTPELDGFDFDRVAVPARLDLALLGHDHPDHSDVVADVTSYAARLLALQNEQVWGQPYAPPDGWGWGSNGRVLNNLVVLIAAHLLTDDSTYRDAVATGIDYLLGRNALGQSYITGYGTDSTRHQRTRQFGHDLDPTLPPPPPGAIAGGPNSQPSPDFPYDDRLRGLPPQFCYLDEPTSEVTNDICVRWNSPLVYVAAFLATAPRQ